MRKHNILTAILITLLAISTTAQEKYRAVNWGLDEGLSQGEVYAMIKDVNGFLWVGTTFGLNRFDGSRFKKYYADKHKKNKTIIGNEIHGLIEDSLHNIWIGTDKGLSCYDTKADSFRNISSDLPGAIRFFEGNPIVPFWATRDEVFCWDYPESQLAAYNIHSLAKRTLTKITHADSVGHGVSDQYAIFDAGSNSIWMEKGYVGVGGGLLQVSLADGKRKRFDWFSYKKRPNDSHWSEGMRYDRKRNSIWINSPDGLVKFTLNDKKFHHIDALNEFVNLKDFWKWAGIDIDPNGRVWIGTHPKGIIIYDPANNSVDLPFPNDSVRQKNVSDENVSLYCDKDGMVWSGFFSRKGIYQLIPFSPAVKRYVADAEQAHGLTSDEVFNVIHGGQGTLWMGSPDGIEIFNPGTGFFNLLLVKDLQGIKAGGKSSLLPINVDTIGKKAWIYINYDEPFFEMDLASKKCSHVLYADGKGNKSPLLSVLANHPQNWHPIAYKNELIIAASFPDHQEILVENNNDPVARKILFFPDETVDLFSVFTNDDNLLFLRRPNATTNLTYADHHNKWTRTPTPLDSIPWSGIFYNKADHTYWIIVETQLIQYDENFRLIHKYTNEDGMPGVKIHGLIPDNKGNIWFNTDRSIFQLNTKTGTITMLTEKDGYLPQDFFAFSGAKDDDGDIYIPGSVGFDRVSPAKYVFSNSSVYFESLKINQQPYPLTTGINHVGELSLKYFENNIVIETGTIDYYSKGKGRIRYKLEAEGKKTGWQYAPADYTIRYEGLPPGKYKLLVQASNAANEFIGPEKSLLILVSAPYWHSWWFISLVVGIVVMAINALFQFRLKQKMKVLLVRQKLHRDLHDDVGATLSSIKVYSEILQNNSDNTLIAELIKTNAADMIDKLEIIAWATNPQHDTFKSFKELINRHASSICYAKRISLSIKSEEINDTAVMPGDIRQNLFLIFKEALNNIIKHAEASQCQVSLSMVNQHLCFVISDNGKGFMPNDKVTGNGIKNMYKRSEEIKAGMLVQSDAGKGTTLTINLADRF